MRILSAREKERDKVAALDAGADDFVSKPFGVGELLARVRALLRRAALLRGDEPDSVFLLGDLSVDLSKRRVTVRGEDVHLTPIEYRLLETLVRHAGRVVTQRQLLKEVWGHLPERVRRQMQSGSPEEVLPKYQKLIEEYYKRLAEDAVRNP